MSDSEVEKHDDKEKLELSEDEEIDFSPVDSEVEDEDDETRRAALLFSTLRATPSRTAADSDLPKEVTNNKAVFYCLEELFQAGKLTGTEVSMYKAHYQRLDNYLKQSRTNEFQLLQVTKRYTTELEVQRTQLAKAEVFPDKIVTEVDKLREQLLKSHNSLSAIEERSEENTYKLETLKEEKRLLEREYQRMPKAEEIEKQKKLLEDSTEELRLEIDRYRRESKKQKEILKATSDQEKDLEVQCETTRTQVDKLKGELLSVNSVPVQLSKEREKLRKQTIETEKEKSELDSQLEGLKESVEKMEKNTMALETEIAELRNVQLKEQEKLSKAQEEFDLLTKEYETDKEKEMSLLADKAAIDMNFRHLELERKNLFDTQTRRLREKDREVRNLKKAQLQLKVTQEGLTLVQQMYDKTKDIYDAFPREDKSEWNRRVKLQNEVEVLKRNLEHENGQIALQSSKVQQSVQEEERLLYEVTDLRIEVVELTRLATIKADEREHKARDFMRADKRYDRATEDLKAKQLQIKDHIKKFKETQVRLQEFSKLYDVIKAERNKCVNAIQTTTQKASEMREKLRILHNEVEILRANLQTKEKQLNNLRMKHANVVVMRDTLRRKISKSKAEEEVQRERKEQMRLDMQRMDNINNRAEEEMQALRKASDRAVQNRNDRGVQLIERNEEVCILQEKVKIQETLIRTGEVELKNREDEIAFLKRHMQEEQRQIDLLKKQMPHKRHLENELTTLQIQLSLSQDYLAELEEAAENPEKSGRLRLLPGKDPTPLELQTKMELLEQRLASKEEQLLEKDLLFDAVGRLVEGVERKALSGRDDTLNLAKDVNGFKSNMSTVTKRMKATTAELTMYMAQALKLQQDVREKEFELEQCYRRLEKGEPPSDAIENEWRRTQDAKFKRQRESDYNTMVAEEEAQYLLTNGGVTTAEPRPNAYIPDDDAELPIPRPYGGHAPFRPTEQGTNMRHIRKPKLKPIEI